MRGNTAYVEELQPIRVQFPAFCGPIWGHLEWSQRRMGFSEGCKVDHLQWLQGGVIWGGSTFEDSYGQGNTWSGSGVPWTVSAVMMTAHAKQLEKQLLD